MRCRYCFGLVQQLEYWSGTKIKDVLEHRVVLDKLIKYFQCPSKERWSEMSLICSKEDLGKGF